MVFFRTGDNFLGKNWTGDKFLFQKIGGAISFCSKKWTGDKNVFWGRAARFLARPFIRPHCHSFPGVVLWNYRHFRKSKDHNILYENIFRYFLWYFQLVKVTHISKSSDSILPRFPTVWQIGLNNTLTTSVVFQWFSVVTHYSDN